MQPVVAVQPAQPIIPQEPIKQPEVNPDPVVIEEPIQPTVIVTQKPLQLPALKAKKQWEKSTENYAANYGPNNMYADFRYKGMNYEQVLDARKKRFILEQNN